MDQSHLDSNYFVDADRYNCPFCKRGSVQYEVIEHIAYDFSNTKKAYLYFVECNGCGKVSMHTSFKNIQRRSDGTWYGVREAAGTTGLIIWEEFDEYFIHHQPSSFFTIDERIPKEIRELVSEAEGCAKMNFMVGASGALRKAIYEFLKKEKAIGKDYESRVKSLKPNYPLVPGDYFDSLATIQGMTSVDLHEQATEWEPFSKKEFDFVVETVKTVLEEVYVMPEIRRLKREEIAKLGQAKAQASPAN